MLCQAEGNVMDWLGDVLTLAHRTAYSGCGAKSFLSGQFLVRRRTLQKVVKLLLKSYCVVDLYES